MKKNDIRKQRVYRALMELCPVMEEGVSPYEAWPKTRDVADACNETIYSARLHLLALAQEGRVFCSYENVKNSLRWYPRRHRAPWDDEGQRN